MAHTLWNADDRRSLTSRFDALSPAAQPKWGSFTAPRMLTHVTDGLRAALGELPVARKAGPLGYWPINVLVMFYLPWPKSAPTAPELLARTPEEWTRELDELKGAIERFTKRNAADAWPAHAAFGDIGGTGWGRLQYRHLDHHLTQFGV